LKVKFRGIDSLSVKQLVLRCASQAARTYFTLRQSVPVDDDRSKIHSQRPPSPSQPSTLPSLP
jgi:hypothetical protein